MQQLLRRTDAPIDWSVRAVANHAVLTSGSARAASRDICHRLAIAIMAVGSSSSVAGLARSLRYRVIPRVKFGEGISCCAF
jgi:hypothetical protein